MKKLFLLAVALVGLCSCTSDKYVIKGNIEGLDEYVYMFNTQGQRLDSTKAENGKFRFEGVANTLDYVYVTNGDSKHKFTVITILEPGRITLRGKLENPSEITPAGTVSNDGYADYLRRSREMGKRFRAPDLTLEERKALAEEGMALDRTVLTENRDNFFGVMLLAEHLVNEMSATEILEAAAGFSESLQRHELLIKVKSEAKDKLKTEPGQPFINVVQNTPQGEPAALRNVIANPANKYVLVNFWASWCRPCMLEAPFLVEDYKQYRAKGLEIYGISLDKDREAWTNAIKTQGMEWIQVSSLSHFANQAARDYGVRTIPFNFLIDCSTGKIVAVNLHIIALSEKLAELMK